MKGIKQVTSAALFLLLLTACSDGGYYLQAARGHLSILAKRQPLEVLLTREDTAPEQKERLARILAIRRFASTELALPDNGSYRSYVELDRPYPLWNLVAAPEFSLDAKTWCFPIAGCVAYRGYFKEADARAHAERLRRQNFDTLVVGIPAYSTLSWFDDPVLSSFSHWPTSAIARLIFHELAHQQLYLPGDSDFSEAFATSVERVGTRLWLEAQGTPKERATFEAALDREAQFLAWANRLHQRLEQLYASDRETESMRRQKMITIAGAKEEFAQLKQDWDGYSGYDHWLKGLNNARLASLQTYHRLLPAFERLYADSGFDLQCYYSACRALSELDPKERNSRFAALNPATFALETRP